MTSSQILLAAVLFVLSLGVMLGRSQSRIIAICGLVLFAITSPSGYMYTWKSLTVPASILFLPLLPIPQTLVQLILVGGALFLTKNFLDQVTKKSEKNQ